MKKISFPLVVFLSSIILSGCTTSKTEDISSAPTVSPVVEQNQEVVYPEENLVEVASAAGKFSTLLAAVEKAGLSDSLANEEFTVFAPTDEAFAKITEAELDKLMADPESLANVLKFHLLNGRVMANEVVLLTAAVTANGEEVVFSASDSGVKVNNANIIQMDVLAKNGVIHVIDSVLLPE